MTSKLIKISKITIKLSNNESCEDLELLKDVFPSIVSSLINSCSSKQQLALKEDVLIIIKENLSRIVKFDLLHHENVLSNLSSISQSQMDQFSFADDKQDFNSITSKKKSQKDYEESQKLLQNNQKKISYEFQQNLKKNYYNSGIVSSFQELVKIEREFHSDSFQVQFQNSASYLSSKIAYAKQYLHQLTQMKDIKNELSESSISESKCHIQMSESKESSMMPFSSIQKCIFGLQFVTRLKLYLTTISPSIFYEMIEIFLRSQGVNQSKIKDSESGKIMSQFSLKFLMKVKSIINSLEGLSQITEDSNEESMNDQE